MIGVSMGGAAALLGARPLAANAVVLEAVYSTIDRAIENRLVMRLGALGRLAAPLFVLQIEPFLGIPAKELSPVAAVSRSNGPVLIIGGSADRHTQPDEIRELFRRAPEPKSLWILNGAAHVDFHEHAPADYEERVLRFFRTHLLSSAASRLLKNAVF